MPKLTELKGAENLPKKKSGRWEITSAGSKEITSFTTDGHNSAVSQMESCGIKVNVEKLARKLHTLWVEHCFGIGTFVEAWDDLSKERQEYFINQAQALAERAGEYLEIEVIK